MFDKFMESVVKQPSVVVPIMCKFLSPIVCSCQLHRQAVACPDENLNTLLPCELSWLFLLLAMPELL